MMQTQELPLGIRPPATNASAESPSRLTSVLKSVVVVYVLGMLVLIVEQFTLLYSNLALVDFWNVLLLPVCWLYFIRTRRALRFPFAIAMWLILLGSLIATIFALNPPASLVVILKEVYLYVWFVTLTAIFASLELGLLRRALIVWVAVVVLHGGLLIAEFVVPQFYGFMLAVLGRVGGVDVRYIGRSAGFFQDPVWAALFQLMGFVPLLLAGFRRELSWLLGMVLLLSIVATASLGALAALAGASAVALLIYLLLGGHPKLSGRSVAVVTLVAGLFFSTLILVPDVLTRLEQLTIDRAAHTLGERLYLWGGGTEVLFSPASIVGVGPDNYRDFMENKTLHNDALEFGVERGIIGLLGLALLVGGALNDALKMLLKEIKAGGTALPNGLIFLAMLVGLLLESNAHQIFHFRIVWVGLALLEAIFIRTTSLSTEEPVTGPIERQAQRRQSQEKTLPLTGHRDPSSVDAG